MAKKARLSRWTYAIVSTDKIDTGAAVHTRLINTIVLVCLAVVANIAVDTDTLVSTLCILTGAMVLAGIVSYTLVHVLAAVPALPVDRTFAGIRVNSINTGGPVLT